MGRHWRKGQDQELGKTSCSGNFAYTLAECPLLSMTLSEVGTAHCALPLFRNALNERAPQLVFDQEFAPEGETFLRVAAEACVAGDATVSNLEQLLLALSFPFGFRNEENGHDDHRRRG